MRDASVISNGLHIKFTLSTFELTITHYWRINLQISKAWLADLYLTFYNKAAQKTAQTLSPTLVLRVSMRKFYFSIWLHSDTETFKQQSGANQEASLLPRCVWQCSQSIDLLTEAGMGRDSIWGRDSETDCHSESQWKCPGGDSDFFVSRRV